jgi:hypothetical protein
MTSTFARIGVDDVSERALLLLDADSSAGLPVQFVVGSKYFVSLLAWDSRAVATADIAHVARVLLDAGCVYFCCWGPGCERVHDIIDEEYVGDGTSVNDDESTIMTTWHTEESLEEATWFALNVAFPDDRFFDSCKAVVSICIGNPEWKAALEKSLANPRALAARVVAEDSPPPNKSLERTLEG